MPFDEFKQRHHGTGPFAAFYEASTQGEGLFGVRSFIKERDLTDDLIARVQSDEDMKSLSAAAEAGKAPMTRAEHAQFRAGLMQAAMNKTALDKGYQGFVARLDDLGGKTVSPEDEDRIKNHRMIGEAAYALINTGDPNLVAKGQQQLAAAMTSIDDYSTQNEEQRLQIEAADKNDRNTQRNEYQSLLNTNVVGPYIQDQAEYGAIYSQVAELDDDAVVPPAIISAALNYSGAALRQSEDGHWSFSFGGVGFQDQDVPTMTASQVRNRMNQAHEGRAGALKGAGDEVTRLATAKGFGVNGAEVEDLIYPLANQEYKRRERDIAPSAPSADKTAESAEKAATAAQETIEGAARGIFGDAPIDAAQETVSRVFGAEVPGTSWLRNLREGKPLFPTAPPAVDYSIPTTAAERARRRGASGGQNLSGAAPARLPTNDPVPRVQR